MKLSKTGAEKPRANPKLEHLGAPSIVTWDAEGIHVKFVTKSNQYVLHMSVGELGSLVSELFKNMHNKMLLDSLSSSSSLPQTSSPSTEHPPVREDAEARQTD